MTDAARPPRVAIAGYGLAGRIFHAPLLRGCGFEVCAVLTNSAERISHVAQDFPEARVTSSISDLVEQEVDLLVVASANVVHVEQALAGIRAGIPVVVDKPMGRTLGETELIISEAAARSVPVTVFFNRRWDSDALTIKRVMKEGLLGNIFRMESRFERFRPNLTPGSWREGLSSEEGGGLLLDLQSHLLSQALDFFGPATLEYAAVRSLRGAADDDVFLTLNHVSGVDSYLSTSAVVGAPGPRMRIIGSSGALIINDLDPQENALRSGEYPHGGEWSFPTNSRATLHRGDEVVEVPSENGNYALFYQLVKGALAGENDWPVSTSDALAVAALVDQARTRSSR